MNLRNYKHIIICGKPQAGKNTLSEILAYHTGKKHGTCSDIIYENLSATFGMGESHLRSLPKEYIRHLLVAHGDHLTEDDPSFLVDRLIEDYGCEIICGVRRINELDAIMRKHDSLVSVWVERPEQEEIKDNTEIYMELCTMRITNDGSITDLENKVKGLI